MSSSADLSVARIRQATKRLVQAGIVPSRVDVLLRNGAAEMVERCLAKWDESQGSRVLAQMVQQGGPSEGDGARLSDRERIVREMNAWMEPAR